MLDKAKYRDKVNIFFINKNFTLSDLLATIELIKDLKPKYFNGSLKFCRLF